MREFILGTAGHVDHGKTSLIKALTGIETDRLKEEKERGITIELGFAFLDLPCGRRLGIVDVPGHERFVKNMVAGAAGIDLVAFVIAADEGIMPQTREHFEICDLLGIRRGLIVITKKDLVEPEWLEMVQEEVRDFFQGSFLEEAPMVTVSSISGEGVEEVRQTLDRLVAASERQDIYGPFRMPVDRIFSMKGFGAVVTGTSISGRLGVGDEVMLYPRALTGKIRGVQVHGVDVREAEAGHRTAINVQGVEKEMIRRGDVLATAGSLAASYVMDADFLYLSGNKKKLKNRTRVRVHLGTAEIMGRVALLDCDEAEPGNRYNVQLLLEEPAAVWPGDHYVVRSYSPVRTIGGGRILNGTARKRRRFRPEQAGIFEIYRSGTPEELVLLHLREAGLTGLTFDEVAIKVGVFGKRLQKLLSGPISARRILVIESEKQRMLAEAVYLELQEKVNAVLAAYHQEQPLKPGLAKEDLRFRVHTRLDQRLFQVLLQDLINQEKIVPVDGLIRLAGHQVTLQQDTETLRQEIAEVYRLAGLTPPNLREVLSRFGDSPAPLVREMLELLSRDQVIAKITEELYFHRTHLLALQEKIVNFLKQHGEIDAQGFKGLTGLSRKYSIPLQEYFDKQKITIRVGDKRILREKRS